MTSAIFDTLPTDTDTDDTLKTYDGTTSPTPGVLFSLSISGDSEATEAGPAALSVLSDVIAKATKGMGGQRYTFSDTVSRSVTVYDGDDEYTLTVSFAPTKRRDLRHGVTELSALNVLSHALAETVHALSDKALYEEVLDKLGPVGAILLSALAG